MTDARYSKKEAINRILRALEGETVENTAPEILSGDVLSEDAALSNIASLLAGDLPGESGVIPPALKTLPGAISDSKNFYVIPDHVNASDANTGENPAFPLRTIQQAVTNARSYRGDIIWVTSSDSWPYSSGTSTGVVECVIIPPTKPGISLVGVAGGSRGCYWKATGTNAFCLQIRAVDIVVEGFYFWLVDGGAKPKGIFCDWDSGPGYFGDNSIIRNNWFNCTTGIQIEFCYATVIENNHFLQCDYGVVISSSGSGAQLPHIYNNHFNDCGYAMYLNRVERGEIFGNRIYNSIGQATGTCTDRGLVISVTGTYNIISDNYFSIPLSKWNEFNTGAPSDSWINNHCGDGLATTRPT